MPRYYIWTIGCQMNKAESEQLSSTLEQGGFVLSPDIRDADLVILNSCVVRESAENKVVNKLHYLRHLKKTQPSLSVALTGCIVGEDIAALKKKFPFVDYFFQPGQNPPWVNNVILQPRRHAPVSVLVPINQGCNNFCSYCIVPYRRGRERSRSAAMIENDIREAVKCGAREAILLGQNVDSYGHDLADKLELADLLEKINRIEGLERIRFLTNHPKDMTDRLIDTIARLDKVCKQVSLPVQSGDNEILNAMNRGYTVEHYKRLVNRMREKIPDIALSTDIIVGFPSETEQQFLNTYKLLEEFRFYAVHIAAYSPREGTKAARLLPDDVPPEVKKLRVAMVEQLQEKVLTGINELLLDTDVEVLFECRKNDKWQGRTKTDKLVFTNSNDDLTGKIIRIHVERTSPWSLQGKIIDHGAIAGE